jgi:hypothetical protein
MNCELCDRNNVVKAYCYFTKRERLFMEITTRSLNYYSFAEFAIEYSLEWKWGVTCAELSRSKAKLLWDKLKPYLVEALQKSKSSGGPTIGVKI